MKLNRRGFFGAIAGVLLGRPLLQSAAECAAPLNHVQAGLLNGARLAMELDIRRLSESAFEPRYVSYVIGPPLLDRNVLISREMLEDARFDIRAKCADCGVQVTAEQAWSHSCERTRWMSGSK